MRLFSNFFLVVFGDSEKNLQLCTPKRQEWFMGEDKVGIIGNSFIELD